MDTKILVPVVIATVILVMLRTVSKSWATTWVVHGGRALAPSVSLDSIAAD